MADFPPFANIGADGADNSKAAAPGPPATWPPAGQGKAGSDNGKSCGVAAQPGLPGVAGYTGAAGADGGTPGDGGQIKMDITEMTGTYIFLVQGGAGGKGGPGGVGGTGQNGGPGGAASSHCGAGPQGPAGAGGLGGRAGNGTDGGKAESIYITYTVGNPPPTISATIRAGSGGTPGTPGNGGPAGTGVGGGGSLGVGPNGYTGKAGTNGQLFVNGKAQPANSSTVEGKPE